MKVILGFIIGVAFSIIAIDLFVIIPNNNRTTTLIKQVYQNGYTDDALNILKTKPKYFYEFDIQFSKDTLKFNQGLDSIK